MSARSPLVLVAALVAGTATTARADTRAEITKLLQRQAASFDGEASFTDEFADDALVMLPGFERVSHDGQGLMENVESTWEQMQFTYRGSVKVLGVEELPTGAMAAAELTLRNDDVDMDGKKHKVTLRLTAYLERKPDKSWVIRAAHYSLPMADADLFRNARSDEPMAFAALGKDGLPPALAQGLKDPKLLAASIDKKAFGFGTAPAEKFIGGDKLKKAWLKWNLVFDASSVVVKGPCVAANLTATIKVKGKPLKVPFRVLFIRDGSGPDARVMSAHFAAAHDDYY